MFTMSSSSASIAPFWPPSHSRISPSPFFALFLFCGDFEVPTFRDHAIFLGSSASRRPSPTRLNDSTVRKIASPGQIAIQGALVRKRCAELSIEPHEGAGGCWPRPRNESAASAMIAAAIDKRRLHQQRGQDVRQDVEQRDAPARIADGARGLDIVLDLHGHHLPARQAHEDRRGGDADRDHGVAEAGPEERRERDRQNEERDGEHRVGDAREQRVDPAAEIAGDQPERHADRRARSPTEITPASSEARAPKMTRASTSRPTSSVPNQCSAGRRLAHRGPALRRRIERRDQRREHREQRRTARSRRGRRPRPCGACSRRSARRIGLSTVSSARCATSALS